MNKKRFKTENERRTYLADDKNWIVITDTDLIEVRKLIYDKLSWIKVTLKLDKRFVTEYQRRTPEVYYQYYENGVGERHVSFNQIVNDSRIYDRNF